MPHRVAVLLVVILVVITHRATAQSATATPYLSATDLISIERAAVAEGKPAGNSGKPLIVTPSHRVVLRYRAVDARPEMHTAISEVFLIRTGSSAIRIGGQLLNPEPEPNDRLTMMGSKVEGGTLYRVGPGDVVFVPVGIPHGWEFQQGEAVTYTMIQVTESK